LIDIIQRLLPCGGQVTGLVLYKQAERALADRRSLRKRPQARNARVVSWARRRCDIDDRELISAACTDEFGVGSVGVIGSHYY
jgi:hypothetical protein